MAEYWVLTYSGWMSASATYAAWCFVGGDVVRLATRAEIAADGRRA